MSSQSKDSTISTPGLVNIITRTKDRPLFLKRAIKSVRGQSYPNWIHIIVNDAGNAQEVDALIASQDKAYQERAKVIHLKENLGMMAAGNKALERVEGEFVVIHDDDDSWDPEFLEKGVQFLNQKGPDSLYQGVITQTTRIWESFENDSWTETSREPYQPLPEISLFRVGFENPFPPIAFLFRKKALNKVGLLNTRFSYAADLDFNIRFLSHFEIGVIQEPLANYHWREGDHADNSVTKEQTTHGILLNEILNEYLRDEINSHGSNLGLALNMSRYAVYTQGRSDAIIERLADLKKALLNETSELCERNQTTQEKLAQIDDLKAHLNSINKLLDEPPEQRHQALLTQQQDLKKHLDSISHAIEPTSSRFDDLKNHLNSISKLLDEPQNQRHQALLTQQQDLKKHLDSISHSIEPTSSRFDDLKNHLNSISNATIGESIPLTKEIQEDIATLKATLKNYKRSWKIGPIRISWEGKDKET